MFSLKQQCSFGSALFFLITFAFSPVCHAAIFKVLNTNDSGAGSLRQAVIDANALSGDDVIVFDASLAYQTINLTSGEILIGDASHNDSLTISGPVAGAANSIVIDAGGLSRIFITDAYNYGTSYSSYGLITLENMTLTNGHSMGTFSAGSGGAVKARRINLVVNDCVIKESISDADGGGIYLTFSSSTINRSIIVNNSASSAGGGIRGYFSLMTINHSMIIGNSGSMGGGVYGSAEFINSSLINNTASSRGGGIYFPLSTTTAMFNQATISGNTSAEMGGGIYSLNRDIIINQSTITNNTSNSGSSEGAGGVYIVNTHSSNNYSVTMTNSILSDNTGVGGNFYSKLASTGTITLNATNSLLGDIGEVNGTDIANIENNVPNLMPLDNHGGITKIHLPNTGSPALNAGSNALATEAYDQRGTAFKRIVNTTVDIGAAEREVSIDGGDNEVLTRGDMAKALLERLIEVMAIGDPPAYSTGLDYHDVQANNPNANWIAHFKAEGFTEGCASNKFCPDSVVTKEDMAKFFLLALNGDEYDPLPHPDNFSDVDPSDHNAAWIFDLDFAGYTAGCATGRFCPKSAVTREYFQSLLGEL